MIGSEFSDQEMEVLGLVREMTDDQRRAFLEAGRAHLRASLRRSKHRDRNQSSSCACQGLP